MIELPSHCLVAGMTGSGKTTLAIRYLLNAKPACRFLFDDGGRFSRRLNITPCYSLSECEAALATRWVIFNPARMFPADFDSSFAWFCRWTFACAQRGPGLKILAVDELWQWADSRKIPAELRMCVQAGREQGIQLVTCTQEPHRVNSSIVGQAGELICFRLQEPKSLACVADLNADAESVSRLPLGSFVACNRLSGAKLSGKVF